jgi:lipoprotein signal peptidase
VQPVAVRGLGVLTAVGVMVADQSSKAWASGAAVPGVDPVRNRGLLFGVLAGPPVLVAIEMIAVLGVFLVVIGRWAVQVGISPVIPGVIAGGSLANAFDRAQSGAVRDFLATPWVVVNVADIAVVLGIVALGLALAWRVHQLRSTSHTITLDRRTLRAIVVPARAR